jgi:hypothetical protein
VLTSLALAPFCVFMLRSLNLRPMKALGDVEPPLAMFDLERSGRPKSQCSGTLNRTGAVTQGHNPQRY